MKKKMPHTKKENQNSFRWKLLSSIFRIAAPVTAIVCAISVIMLTLNYRQTVINSQAAATEKVRSDLANIIDNTQTLSQDMIFNSEIQQMLRNSTAGEQFPQNADAAYHINGFIANRDYINCVILTGNNQTLYSTEKAFTNISDYNTILHSKWLAQLRVSSKPYLWYVDPDYRSLLGDSDDADSTDQKNTDLHVSSDDAAQERPGTPQHIMMARPVYSMSDYKSLLGYLMLYLDDDYIHTLLGNFDFGRTTNVWLINSDGSVILQNDVSSDYSYLLKKLNPEEKGFILSAHGRHFVFNMKPVTDNGWYLYTATPFREVCEPLVIFILQAILLSGAMIAILFFLSLRTASTLSAPIIQLAHTMDAYRNDMKPVPFPGRKKAVSRTNSNKNVTHSASGIDSSKNVTHSASGIDSSESKTCPAFGIDSVASAVTVGSGTNKNQLAASIHDQLNTENQPDEIVHNQLNAENQPDEIIQIYQSYQHMIDRMDTLIRENFIKNLEKKDAELALLQSQINPHFLYNTLDSINWMAIANDEDEISEMVTALSDMFRLSLTKSHSSFVQVTQEMEYVRSYLLLQQFRYQDCLQVSVVVPDTVAELYIPRFTLQPLVENAIKHGIVSPDEPFSIQLEFSIDDPYLHIRIGNDGTRISLDLMKKLLDFDVSSQELLDFDQNSYGVQNIHRRVQILCGTSYGLSYEIRDGRTWCDLKLPVITRDPVEPEIPFQS